MTERVNNALQRAERLDIVDALNDAESLVYFLRSPSTCERAIDDPATSYWLRDLLQSDISQEEARSLQEALAQRYQNHINAA